MSLSINTHIIVTLIHPNKYVVFQTQLIKYPSASPLITYDIPTDKKYCIHRQVPINRNINLFES